MAFLVTLPIAGAIALAYDKKIEEGIPVAMFIATFITYLCGIFGILTFSPVFVGIFSVIGLALSICGIVKEKSLRRFLTFGGISFLLLGVYYAFVMKGRMLAEQDDLLVYGKYIADFYHVGSIIRYDYIPGMMMWEYLSERCWPVFSESILFLSVAMLCVGMMLAIFSKKNKRDILYYIFVLMVIVLVPVITKGRDSYFKLQNDFVMGVTMAYILCMYQKGKEYGDVFYKKATYCGLAFLTLTKVTGFVLALILIIMLVGIDVIPERKTLSINSMKYIIGCLLSVIIPKLSWSIFAKRHGELEKFSEYGIIFLNVLLSRWYLFVAFSAIVVISFMAFKWVVENGRCGIYITALVLLSAAVVIFTYFEMPLDIRNNAISNFGKVLFSTYAPDRYFGFGYRFYIPYFVVIVFLMFVWNIVEASAQNKNCLANNICIYLNVGFIIFSSFVFLSNFYTRTLSQASRAKECERYLYAYIVFYLIVCLASFTEFEMINDKTSRIVTIFLGVIMLTIANVSGIFTQIREKDSFYNFDGLNYISINEDDLFFYVDQIGELNYSRFNYRISPGTMIHSYFMDMVVDDVWLKNDEPERYMTIDEWKGLLFKCTYVYVAATNDEFANMYGDLFEDEIIDGHIYRVKVDGDDIRLESIEYMDEG